MEDAFFTDDKKKQSSLASQFMFSFKLCTDLF